MPIGSLRLRNEWLAIISLAVVTIGIWCRVLSTEQPTFRAVFLDVGQGDCAYLRSPSGRVVLIDGGGTPGESPDDMVGLRVVAPFLRREAVNRIDVMVLTHPHDDHVEGLIPVLRDFRVGMVLDSANPDGSESYQRFRAMVRARGIPYRRAVRGQVVDFGDGVRARVLHPPSVRLAGTEDDVNDNSVVMRFTCGKYALLMTGDAGEDAESDILGSGASVRSDVLKVAHHGSESATSDDWLDSVQPRLAVISVSKGNPFGHPSGPVLKRLSARHVKIYRTDRNGAVALEIVPGQRGVHVSPAVRDASGVQ